MGNNAATPEWSDHEANQKERIMTVLFEANKETLSSDEYTAFWLYFDAGYYGFNTIIHSIQQFPDLSYPELFTRFSRLSDEARWLKCQHYLTYPKHLEADVKHVKVIIQWFLKSRSQSQKTFVERFPNLQFITVYRGLTLPLEVPVGGVIFNHQFTSTSWTLFDAVIFARQNQSALLKIKLPFHVAWAMQTAMVNDPGEITEFMLPPGLHFQVMETYTVKYRYPLAWKVKQALVGIIVPDHALLRGYVCEILAHDLQPYLLSCVRALDNLSSVSGQEISTCKRMHNKRKSMSKLKTDTISHTSNQADMSKTKWKKGKKEKTNSHGTPIA
jgi:hypothetical protein